MSRFTLDKRFTDYVKHVILSDVVDLVVIISLRHVAESPETVRDYVIIVSEKASPCHLKALLDLCNRELFVSI